MAKREEFLFVEKYRPQSVDECILPERLKKIFKDVVNKGDAPNFTFTGTSGTGKTTIARALAKQLGYDLLYINASKDGNIDTLRTRIVTFASTVSLMGNRKMILLDEADFLNPVSTQPALRGVIEEYSKNCAFILTVNYKEKLLPALIGRAPIVEFRFPKEERPILATQFLKRLTNILDMETITYDKKVLADLISRHFPDFRRILGEVQQYSLAGTIDDGILLQFSDVKVSALIKAMKSKDFAAMTKWVVENSDGDPTRLFRTIYDGFEPSLNPNSVPQFVITLAD
jgi:DNA polymerase III delta prime subunit